MVLLEHSSNRSPGVLRAPVDERAARCTLRTQIARLERELCDTVAAAFPHVPSEPEPARPIGPHLPDLGELEHVRDELAERVRRARVVVRERAELEAHSRARLEEMLRDPRRHKWARLPVADLGEPGCGAYRVRPRLGLIGMLMGWWHVKLSSGCPLPGHRPEGEGLAGDRPEGDSRGRRSA